MQAFRSVFFVAVFGVVLVGAAPNGGASDKVFKFDGPMTVRDDRTGEVLSLKDENVTDEPVPTSEQLAATEAACWKLIVEQSEVTFALQNKVLDELEMEMKNLTMDKELRESVDKTNKRMRANMAEALDALKREAAEDYFDALFDASEDIINMSSMIRDPKLDETVFLTIVKAVSRLGRNNSYLIQEFTDVCSVAHRSVKPRFAKLVQQ